MAQDAPMELNSRRGRKNSSVGRPRPPGTSLAHAVTTDLAQFLPGTALNASACVLTNMNDVVGAITIYNCIGSSREVKQCAEVSQPPSKGTGLRASGSNPCNQYLSIKYKGLSEWGQIPYASWKPPQLPTSTPFCPEEPSTPPRLTFRGLSTLPD